MQLIVQSRPAYAYTGGKAFADSGPCVVFIHGALHDHSVWTLLARWCAHHGHRVLALDLPGHGRSAGPPLASVEALGAWVLAALASAGLSPDEPVAYVGHSLGSLIALEAAAQTAPGAGRLMMVGTAYPMAVSPALLALAAQAPQQAIALVNQLSISTLAAKPSFPGPGQWLHGSNRALMRRVLAGAHAASDAPNLFHHDFSLCDRYVNGLIAAAQVRCPTTLVLGRSDQMTPLRQARELAAALSARVVTLEAGHSLMAESPDAVLAALRQALADSA